jgi:hypothetical protein
MTQLMRLGIGDQGIVRMASAIVPVRGGLGRNTTARLGAHVRAEN